jgi:hypothetical protein
MSYKNLINRNLNLAFKLLKDLAETGTLVKKETTNFNFNTGTATSTDIPSLAVKAIPSDFTKTVDGRRVSTTNLLFRVSEITDINRGDKISIPQGTYTINNVIRSDRFLFYVEAAKEG